MRVALGALCLVAAAGIAGTAVFANAWMQQRDRMGAAADVRRVSSDFLTALTNFDPKSVDTDLASVQSYATGDFAKQAQRFFGSNIRQALLAVSASSRGEIRDLYVQSLGGDQASVYAVVDQTYVNDKMKAPAVDVLRMDIDLVRGSSGWLVSDVTVLNGPAPATGAGG